eukprot:g33807.t1
MQSEVEDASQETLYLHIQPVNISFYNSAWCITHFRVIFASVRLLLLLKRVWLDMAQVAGQHRKKRKMERDTALTSRAADPRAALAAAQRLRLAARDESDLQACEQRLRQILAGGPETDAGVIRTARERLALLLAQTDGRQEEAEELMRTLGCEWRLADQVLRYQLPRAEPPSTPPVAQLRETGGQRCVAVDRALPEPLAAGLARLFGPDSPFWTEHDYDVAGGTAAPYFSYAHRLPGWDKKQQRPKGGGRQDSSEDEADEEGEEDEEAEVASLLALHEDEDEDEEDSGMAQAVRAIWCRACELFPKCQEAKYAEWWVHCRPHCCGHQLHFDSDNEGVAGIRNPIASSVLYLSASGVGGPTLVTDQAVTATRLATQGWLAAPAFNRLVLFDGSVLHGVIPGRGVPDLAAHMVGDNVPKRVSLMVSFWKELQRRPRDELQPCASQPFPNEHTVFTWPRLLPRRDEEWELPAARPTPVQTLQHVWAPIKNSSTQESEIPSYRVCYQGF